MIIFLSVQINSQKIGTDDRCSEFISNLSAVLYDSRRLFFYVVNQLVLIDRFNNESNSHHKLHLIIVSLK